MFSNTTTCLEQWFLNRCEKSLDSSVRLTGENSLYEEYLNYSSKVGSPTVGVKEFAKRLELLMALYYQELDVKTRDGKGILFRGILLKDMAPSPASPVSVR